MGKELGATVLDRKKDVELLFAIDSFISPDIVEKCGWLRSEYIQDIDIRKYWISLLETRDPAKAALSVGTDFYIRVSTGSSAYPEINFYYDTPNFAEKIAIEHWLYEIAQQPSRLAQAISEGDYLKVRSIISEMVDSQPTSGTLLPDFADIGLDFIASLSEKNRTIKTYVPGLDDATGGLWRSTLSILCARPRIGKSALGPQIARNAIKGNNKVYFSSLEMSSQQLVARIVCGTLRRPYRDVLTGSVSESVIQQIIETTNDYMELYTGKLILDDAPQSTADLWRKVAKERPDLLVVDHIRLFSDRADNEVKRLGDITWELKKIAKELT